MTIYQYIKIFAPVLLVLEREGISPSDVHYIEAYEQSEAMGKQGVEQAKINAFVLTRYKIPPKILKEIVTRFTRKIEPYQQT